MFCFYQHFLKERVQRVIANLKNDIYIDIIDIYINDILTFLTFCKVFIIIAKFRKSCKFKSHFR